MTKLKLLTVVAIGLSAATMLYLAKVTAAQDANPNFCRQGSTSNSCLVTITPNKTNPNGPPTVDPKQQFISTNQTVEWKCVSETPCVWTAAFKGETPFKENVFYNSRPNSGAPTVPANQNKQYKYSVVVNGKGSVDPIIIIK